ncbi:hypothetical protein [Lichenicola sp.]|uniref:hypothetical protein n=1 Tax=Lichenicola sp. TaxID=2804529 RepID=UPI003B000C62
MAEIVKITITFANTTVVSRRYAPGRPVQQAQPAKHDTQITSKKPLLQTRVSGERYRERFLIGFAQKSARNNWDEDQCADEARREAIAPVIAQKLRSAGTVATLISQARLIGHPDVRNQVPRFLALRDEVWDLQRKFLKAAFHGPSQIFIDIGVRYARPGERDNVVNAKAYLRYLQIRFQKYADLIV